MGEFVEHLKQRKLVQWALAYLAGAFALLQGVDIVAQRFAWPEQAERFLIIALAIGFFVAIVLAWYHGERGAQSVSGTELLIIALLLTIGGAIAWRLAPGVNASAATPPPPPVTIAEKSIAVLPFADLSPGHDQEYFSDGMAEELLNALTKVKDLKVAGRTSSFSFKGKNEDLHTIGRALAVAHVLEGSVRKQGDKVRITAQLIQVADGYHLWSESYDGDLKDVFELQERIARAITEQLKVVLQGDQQQRLVAVATTNAEAYSLYLQATGIFNRREGPRFPEAIAELEQALKLDPKFARAHSRLAAIHALEPIYVPSMVDAALTAAEHEAALASELDPTLAEPHAALAMSYQQRGRYLDARIAMDHALEVDPDDATANLWGGITLIDTGYTARGCALLDHALVVEPLLPNALLWRGFEYVYAGNLQRGEVLLRRAADVGLAHVGFGLQLIYAAHGDTAEATKQVTDGLRVLGTGMPDDVAAIVGAGIYGDAAAHARAVEATERYAAANPRDTPGIVPYSLILLGENRKVMELMARGASTNDALYFHVIWSPGGRALRALPEFRDYAKQSGLTDLWDKYGAPDLCRRIALGDYACG